MTAGHPLEAVPDLHSLMATVLAHPAADLPRLVLADWLEEHDEPRAAELIRVQIERAALPSRSKSAAAIRLGCRAIELVNEYGRDWFGDFELTTRPQEMDRPLTNNLPRALIRRGLPDQLRVPAGWWFGVCDCGHGRPGAPIPSFCPRCVNSGRVFANGPDVVTRSPVTLVRPDVDVVRYFDHQLRKYRWGFQGLVRNIWPHGFTGRGYIPELDVSGSPSKKAALQLFSDAYLGWARRIAIQSGESVKTGESAPFLNSN